MGSGNRRVSCGTVYFNGELKKKSRRVGALLLHEEVLIFRVREEAELIVSHEICESNCVQKRRWTRTRPRKRVSDAQSLVVSSWSRLHGDDLPVVAASTARHYSRHSNVRAYGKQPDGFESVRLAPSFLLVRTRSVANLERKVKDR